MHSSSAIVTWSRSHPDTHRHPQLRQSANKRSIEQHAYQSGRAPKIGAELKQAGAGGQWAQRLVPYSVYLPLGRMQVLAGHDEQQAGGLQGLGLAAVQSLHGVHHSVQERPAAPPGCLLLVDLGHT